MYGDLASEVIHCPNCKEDVPKTLYCLNCGYPLYKIEQEKPFTEPTEPEPEIVEVEMDSEVDMTVEIDQEDVVTVEPEIEPEIELEIEEPELEPEPLPEPEIEPEEEEYEPVEEKEPEIVIEVDELEPEPLPEPEEEVEIEIEAEPEEEEVLVELEEEVYEPVVEEEPVHEVIEVIEETVPDEYVEPETHTEVVEEKPKVIEDIKIEFAPDPLTKEVMENLAKNITLKIRLVRLLRDGSVKEETFSKLFNSYVDQGRIWVGRRDEIIRRFKADIEIMEQSLVAARKDFELLEIRRSIGDANEEEYKVKGPAYRWDIEHLDNEIKNRKAGILYVENLKKLVPAEEIQELQRMSEINYSNLDDIESITSDTLVNMKETLTEALNILQT
jgi:hypothetical protein